MFERVMVKNNWLQWLNRFLFYFSNLCEIGRKTNNCFDFRGMFIIIYIFFFIFQGDSLLEIVISCDLCKITEVLMDARLRPEKSKKYLKIRVHENEVSNGKTNTEILLLRQYEYMFKNRFGNCD